MFNLDLTLIERRLEMLGVKVQSALTMPNVTRQPLAHTTLFVLLLEDTARAADEVGGSDIVQFTTEKFAVIVGVRSPGDVTGSKATALLQDIIKKVKTELVGLMLEPFDPIEFEIGRLIEVNKDTQNVLYQLQFSTAHTVVTPVKHR